MDKELADKLEELKQKTKCTKGYSCIAASCEDLCKAEYSARTDTLECIDQGAVDCINAVKSVETTLCKCAMRKFLATNYKILYFNDPNNL